MEVFCGFSYQAMLITAFPLSQYADEFFHSADGNSYIEWNRNYKLMQTTNNPKGIHIIRSHGNAVNVTAIWYKSH